ncbi:hypothetical protein FOA52_014677 [Chlamydomonas sp. UWO 241]|nr:hypothetical protein FOA52_014677 [Chlamydomonas sp. UWO 241]
MAATGGGGTGGGKTGGGQGGGGGGGFNFGKPPFGMSWAQFIAVVAAVFVGGSAFMQTPTMRKATESATGKKLPPKPTEMMDPKKDKKDKGSKVVDKTVEKASNVADTVVEFEETKAAEAKAMFKQPEDKGKQEEKGIFDRVGKALHIGGGDKEAKDKKEKESKTASIVLLTVGGATTTAAVAGATYAVWYYVLNKDKGGGKGGPGVTKPPPPRPAALAGEPAAAKPPAGTWQMGA